MPQKRNTQFVVLCELLKQLELAYNLSPKLSNRENLKLKSYFLSILESN